MPSTIPPPSARVPIKISPRAPGSWSAHLWPVMESTYRAILEHPFLTGLVNGSLDPVAFAHYLAQDIHYLRDFARVLTVVSAKAMTQEDCALFTRRAHAVAVELTLHAELLPNVGLDAADVALVPVAPTTRAYTSYLLATAYCGTFAEGLAAVLPCYWIYAEVAGALAERGSPDPRYQRWIDSYAADDFTLIVEEILTVVDRVGRGLGQDEQQRASEHLAVTARYEWMFWDAAHRRERWPI